MTTITMFDDIYVSSLPLGAAAYAGYVDGDWPTFPELSKKFPKAHLLSIAVFAVADAECLDIEKGDSTNGQAYAWFVRQLARKVYRPVFYTQASNLATLEALLATKGIKRSAYRIWSAHYGEGAHICGPATCGFGKSSADGTQWTSNGPGHADESVLLSTFFNPRPVPKPPAKKVPEEMYLIEIDMATAPKGAVNPGIFLVNSSYVLLQVPASAGENVAGLRALGITGPAKIDYNLYLAFGGAPLVPPASDN